MIRMNLLEISLIFHPIAITFRIIRLITLIIVKIFKVKIILVPTLKILISNSKTPVIFQTITMKVFSKKSFKK
jgi:hypothetical protein